MRKIAMRQVESLKTTAAAFYPVCECFLCDGNGDLILFNGHPIRIFIQER